MARFDCATSPPESCTNSTLLWQRCGRCAQFEARPPCHNGFAAWQELFNSHRRLCGRASSCSCAERSGREDFMERGDRFSASLTEDERSRLLIDAVTDYAIYMLD